MPRQCNKQLVQAQFGCKALGVGACLHKHQGLGLMHVAACSHRHLQDAWWHQSSRPCLKACGRTATGAECTSQGPDTERLQGQPAALLLVL